MDLISRDKAIKMIRSLWLEAWGSLDDEQTYETNEYAKGLLDAIDAVDDVLGEESEDKTMSFKWSDDIEKPMNPYATEDFKNAMKKAGEDLSKGFKDFSEDLKRIGEQMQTNADYDKMSFIDFDDMPTEYSGVMRLNYGNGMGAWQDVLSILITQGYEVTAWVEDATETEKELDGADKFIVIEYSEVE